MSSEVSTIRAVVRAIHGNEAEVEVESGGCGRCHEKGGCGGQNLTQMFCSGPRTYRVDNPASAAVGDRVTVAIAAGAVRRSANLAYGLPLAALIAGAAAGHQLAGDAGAMAGAAMGIIVAWAAARRILAGNSHAFRPHIISRI